MPYTNPSVAVYKYSTSKKTILLRRIYADLPTHSQPTQQLIPQRLRLRHSTQPAELNLLGVKLETALRELETLLDQRLEFADATTLVAKDLSGVRGAEHDFDPDVGHAGFAA